MEDTIETRTIHEIGKLRITAAMVADDTRGEDLFPDFDNAEDAAIFREHYMRDDFSYVGMVVTIHYDGTEIGSDSLWGIEHGQVGTVGKGGYIGPGTAGEPIIADAWEIVQPQYPAPNSIIGGSSLASVLDEAIHEARKWAKSNGNADMQTTLTEAAKWADPNNPKGWDL